MALVQDSVPRTLNLFMNLVGGPLLLLFLPPVATVSILTTSLSRAPLLPSASSPPPSSPLRRPPLAGLLAHPEGESGPRRGSVIRNWEGPYSPPPFPVLQ